MDGVPESFHLAGCSVESTRDDSIVSPKSVRQSNVLKLLSNCKGLTDSTPFYVITCVSACNLSLECRNVLHSLGSTA